MVRPNPASGGRGTRRPLTVALLTILLPLWLVTLASVAGCKAAPPVLDELDGVNELKARFNADAGKPRIILLLSPT